MHLLSPLGVDKGPLVQVVMATSVDTKHPPENAIDESEKSFWITTGLFPQELIIELKERAKVSTARLIGTNRARTSFILPVSKDADVRFDFSSPS